jgi:hypothetical protein
MIERTTWWMGRLGEGKEKSIMESPLSGLKPDFFAKVSEKRAVLPGSRAFT